MSANTIFLDHGPAIASRWKRGRSYSSSLQASLFQNWRLALSLSWFMFGKTVPQNVIKRPRTLPVATELLAQSRCAMVRTVFELPSLPNLSCRVQFLKKDAVESR